MCRRVTKEEVRDNKDILATTWHPHQNFEALVVKIKMCLVCSPSVKKVILDKDLIKAFLPVIKQRGCYQIGYNMWELLPEKKVRQIWSDKTIW